MKCDPDMGMRFRQIRQELGINQTDMGEMLNRKQRAISYYEQGRLPDRMVLTVLHSMNFSIDWLITGKGKMHIKKKAKKTLTVKKTRKFSPV